MDKNKLSFDNNLKDQMRKKYDIEETINIGYICRIDYVKRPLLLVEIMKKSIAENNKIRFIIGGDGPLLKEMEQRVKQVDLPVFELVNKNMATLSNRMNSNSTCFPLLQNEDIALSQSLLVSKMKGNAKEALDKTTDFLMQLGQQRQLTEKVLLDVRGVNDTKILLVPVLLLTTVADESGSIQNGMILPYDIDGRIADKIRNNVKEDDLGWKENDVDVHVAEAFTAILAKKKLPQRVEKLMKIMFANAKFETLQS